MNNLDRRDFVKFLGGTLALSGLGACSFGGKTTKASYAIKPSSADKLVLSEGLNYELLISWKDDLGKGEKFGFNNDYVAYIPLNESEGLMWVNHEYARPEFVSRHLGEGRTKAHADTELYNVGGSIVHIKKEKESWSVVKDSSYNRRITGHTPIPINAPRPIKGSKVAYGTLANCAGGVTPWQTVLTCEENYHKFFGHTYKNGKSIRSPLRYEDIYKERASEHYGWVVEVDLKTGQAKKQTSLGRFAHECATCIKAKDGRVVVYSGDDAKDEHIYKFISEGPGDLSQGELFVANVEKGVWLSLDINKHKGLSDKFSDQLDLLIHTREAAKIVGASPCDRPEDIEIHPETNDVYVALTNNSKKSNYYGSILKISETNGDPLSMTFTSSTFVKGGSSSGVSCPDNLAFDKAGNLWIVTDMSGRHIGSFPYTQFKNNGLFVVPTTGQNAGIPQQVASAPIDAEFTGICFSPDHKTLFLSVQHPGEMSKPPKLYTSHWPHGGSSEPLPSVVQIKGPLLDKIVSGKA